MAYRVKITEAAEEDLEAIGDYIANDLKNPMAALRMIRELRAKINTLKVQPKRHALDSDEALAGMGIHRQYCKNYKIFYIVNEGNHTVVIV